jgi:hypothetical protein
LGGDRMRHYSLEQWVDFARNVVDENERGEMENHLKTGCVRCSRELGVWQRLQQLARRESSFAPSDGAVRTVNASFANRIGRSRVAAKSGVVSLLFDSFRTPLQAGTRAEGTSSRQMLYGAGSYRIDIRIEPKTDSERVILIGQVLNSANPEESFPELPVRLLKGRKVMAESATSKFGEFQIECALKGGFHLMVKLPGQTDVALPLIEPAFEVEERLPHLADSSTVTRARGARKKGTRTNGWRE